MTINTVYVTDLKISNTSVSGIIVRCSCHSTQELGNEIICNCRDFKITTVSLKEIRAEKISKVVNEDEYILLIKSID